MRYLPLLLLMFTTSVLFAASPKVPTLPTVPLAPGVTNPGAAFSHTHYRLVIETQKLDPVGRVLATIRHPLNTINYTDIEDCQRDGAHAPPVPALPEPYFNRYVCLLYLNGADSALNTP